jgi:hypothetical protein
VVPLFLAAIVLGSLARNAEYLGHDNHAQLEAVREAEGVIPTGGTYFDGIGMLPAQRMAPYLWLDAMGVAKTLAAGKNGPLPQALAADPPDMVILTYRTDALLPLLSGSLGQDYRRVPGTDLLLHAPGAPAGDASLHARRPLFEAMYSY